MSDNIAPPIILTADPYKEKTVYLGPRKIDDPPQATFHYGDAKYTIKFLYKKDGKSAERGPNVKEQAYPEDKKDIMKMKYATGSREPSVDGGGNATYGD